VSGIALDRVGILSKLSGMRLLPFLLSFSLGLCGTVAFAAAPPLENYEVTRLDLRGDLIRDIQIHPTKPAIVYAAGQNGGIFKSTDFGKRWTLVLQMNGRGLALDPRNPDVLYAAGFGGVFKTTDGGKIWANVLKAQLRSAGIHPVSGVVMVGGDRGLIHRSEDGGATWTAPAVTTRGEINKWAFHPKDANIVYHSAAKNHGIHKSTDGGKTFRECMKGEYGRCVAISPSHPEILYASAHKSTDGGETWTPTGGGGAWAVAIHPKNPDIVYKATQGDAVLMTTNGGKHWVQMNGLTRGGQTDLTAHWSIAIDGATDILYVGAAVIYKAEQASSPGAILRESCEGLNTPDVVSIAGTRDVLWVGTDGQGVSRSVDFGRAWERRVLGLRGKLNLGALKIHPRNPDIIYSAGEGGLVKTTNGGRIWLHMPQPGKSKGVEIDPENADVVYTVAEEKIFVSRDGGFQWEEWAKAKGKLVSAMQVHPTAAGVFFARTEAGWERSDDAGGEWQPIGAAGPGNLLVSRNPQTPRTYYSLEGRARLHRSEDGGTSWAPILAGSALMTVSEAADGAIWVGDGDSIKRSADAGKTWQTRVVGFPIRRLLPDPRSADAVYVAANGGLFRAHPAGDELPPAPPLAPAPPPPEPATIAIDAPGVLDRANTVYQLKGDIRAKGTAFFVIADNITIDGQGHTVEFDLSMVEANGVRNLTVKNLIARQTGAKGGASHGAAHAFDLMFCPGATLTGLTIETVLRGNRGIAISGEQATVADNVIAKLGIFSTGISVEGAGAKVLRNKIDATNGGRGIEVANSPGAEIGRNEIRYGGATPVAGMSIAVSPGARIYENRIEGGGRSVGALSVSFSDKVVVEGNEIRATSPLLHFDLSHHVIARKNTLNATQSSVLILSASNAGKITGNTITVAGLKGPAMILEDASNNDVSGNQWTGTDPATAFEQKGGSSGNTLH